MAHPGAFWGVWWTLRQLVGQPLRGIKEGARMPPYLLCEHETIGEVILIEHGGSSCLSDELVNEPIEVPLEYTFALDSVLRKNSIQAGLGGVSLPTTIKDLHEVITYNSNSVAMETNNRLVSFRIESNRSVTRLPVAILRDRGIHFTFDLTHGSVSFELKLVWHPLAGFGENGGHPANWSGSRTGV